MVRGLIKRSFALQFLLSLAMTLVLTSTVLVGVGILGLWACSSAFDFNRIDYGIRTIELPGGQKVYLKHADGGVFYERASLSLNSDRCVGPDDETDYTFISVGAGSGPLYYRVEQNVVTVYATDLRPPSKRKWNIQINQVPLDVGAQQRLERDYSKLGIMKAEVPASELRSCSHWIWGR